MSVVYSSDRLTTSASGGLLELTDGEAPPAVVQSTQRRSGYGEHATRLARRVIGRESGLMARELS